MAQLQSGKYNIAWFKLAEFVIRKEKERAMGIYRLLSYSLPDAGLALQLEGDLLFSFADEKAVESYMKAAGIYEKHNKFSLALALYEQLQELQGDNYEHAANMFRVACLLDNHPKAQKSLETLISTLVKQKKLHEIFNLYTSANLAENYQIVCYSQIVFYLIKNNLSGQENIYRYLDYLLDKFCYSTIQEHSLNLFLTKLEQVDSGANLYNYACSYLNLNRPDAGEQLSKRKKIATKA